MKAMNDQGDDGDLATYIKDWMAEHGVSQASLARGVGIHTSVLGDVLSRGAIPKPATLRRLANVMGVPMATLMVKAGYLDYKDLKIDMVEGLDETVARRLSEYPKAFQRALVGQILPALEQMTGVVFEKRATYAGGQDKTAPPRRRGRRPDKMAPDTSRDKAPNRSPYSAAPGRQTRRKTPDQP